MDKIPVIDLNILTKEKTPSNKSEYQQVAQKIRDALHQIGFMYLTNHNISPEIITEAFLSSTQFFGLDESVKAKYAKIPVETNHGWIKAGQELLNPNSVFELREGFDFVSGEGRPIVECNNFCPTMDKFKQECQAFMKKLLPLLAAALNLDDELFFTKCCTHLNDACVLNECDLRVIYYPPVPADTEIPRGTIRCAEHTDYELCTLLFQDNVGGLEVKTAEGNWISATPISGAILVNTGDLLERWTCGYFPATKHRVIIPEKEIEKRIPRYSFAYFFAPDNTTLVSPLTKISTVLQSEANWKENEEKYRESVTAYDHIMAKVKEAYQ